jgi:subtilisin
MGFEQYVILPSRGLRSAAGTAAVGRRYLAQLVPGRRRGRLTAPGDLVVVDAIGSDGARLVQASRATIAAIRAAQPGLVVAPLQYYRPLNWQNDLGARLSKLRTGTGAVEVTVRTRGTGHPVAGAEVIAIVDVAQSVGALGRTNAAGRARLRLGNVTRIEQLLVFADRGHWSLLRRNVELEGTEGRIEVGLRPLSADASDVVTANVKPSRQHDGAGVRVAVVDTGVSLAHPDLAVVGGLNTVVGESADDFGDNGDAHGTHVAGIIAANGNGGSGRRGIAPAVELHSYRVFGRKGQSASSFAIAKAIDAAVRNGCDLVNLSLGGGDADPVLRAAIGDARAAGSVVVTAAGNDGRADVTFPASEPIAVAVSALGRKGTYPRDATAVLDQLGPYGTDRSDYVAAFSNVGPAIDLIGPGVAVVSTVPGGYGEMSGTSMACPAVTGLAARMLARNPKLLRAERDQARSDETIRRLLAGARSLGFPAELEGRGLPS